MTRKNVESAVYPLSYLKGQLRSWLLDRFNKIMFIAEQYKDQKEKFERVCDLAEKALSNLGEDVYKNEANKFANLLLSSPYLDQPCKFSKAYIRVMKTMTKPE